MKSVGNILKQERKKQKKTILQIHRETKIAAKNLAALEADDFTSLPPATFVKGFIQIYAKNLGLDAKKLIAIFRRDWQKKEKIKIVIPELKTRLWTPKATVILTVIIFSTVFLNYIRIQIKNFFSYPSLNIEEPLENQEIKEKIVKIKGATEKDNSIYVNEKLININDNGKFLYELELFPGNNNIIIKAVNRRGKETIVNRKVLVP